MLLDMCALNHILLDSGGPNCSGGSILANFVSCPSGPIKNATIHAVVRSDEQVQSLLKLGVNVIQTDLSDEKAVVDAVLLYKSIYTIQNVPHQTA